MARKFKDYYLYRAVISLFSLCMNVTTTQLSQHFKHIATLSDAFRSDIIPSTLLDILQVYS
jgi:hypothetical protein